MVAQETPNLLAEVRFFHGKPINGEVSVMVSTTVCEAVSMGSNPIHHPKFYATLAQLVERQPEELGVLGSIPRGCTKFALLAQLVEAMVLEAIQSEFESQRGHQNYTDVMEMVYILDLKSEFCGFKSHLPYQLDKCIRL